MAPVELQYGVDVHKLLKDPKAALMPVLQNIPGWAQASGTAVDVNQISGAMTNLVYRCKFTSPARKVLHALARVFGSSEGLFERTEEQRIFSAVAEVGLGPALLVSFANGRIEEFLLDQSISAEQMRSPPIAACIAASMASFHFCSLSRPPDGAAREPMLWGRLHGWARELRHHYTLRELDALGLHDVEDQIDALQANLAAHYPVWLAFCHNDLQYGNMLLHVSSSRGSNLSRTSMDSSFAGQENRSQEVRGSSPPRLPPHHSAAQRSSRPASPTGRELHESSIPLAPRTNSSTRSHLADGLLSSLDGDVGGESPKAYIHPLQKRRSFKAHASIDSDSMSEAERLSSLGRSVGRLSMRLIDYEYAGINPVAFDIANHWCEYAADYHDGSPHILDYSLYPTREQQLRFVRTYVQAVALLNPEQYEPAAPQPASSKASPAGTAAAQRGVGEPDAVPFSTNIQLHVDEDGYKSPVLVGLGNVEPAKAYPAEPDALSADADADGSSPHPATSGQPQPDSDGHIPASFQQLAVSSQPDSDGCAAAASDAADDPYNSLLAAVLEAEAREGVSHRHSHALPSMCSRAEKAALESVVRKLQEAAWAYLPASHLLWGLWGYIQLRQSEVDFDFKMYADQRMVEYRRLTGQPQIDLN